MLWSVIQKIPWANPVTLYREPTTNFPPNSTWEYALLTRATCYHTTWWHCRHHGCRTLPGHCLCTAHWWLLRVMPPIQCPCQIRWLWEYNTADGTCAAQWQIPLLCSAGPPVQLGRVFLPRWPFCINCSISEPVLPSPFGMWPFRVRPITLPGIHTMPAHLQQSYGSPKPHSCIWWYISDPRLINPLPTFSNEQHDHYILENSGYNYLATPSNMIIINNYCHDTSRPRRP